MLDCLELGMRRREMAIVFYGQDTVNADWTDDRGVMKDAIRYLVNKARGLRNGGHLTELLGGRLGPYQKAARGVAGGLARFDCAALREPLEGIGLNALVLELAAIEDQLKRFRFELEELGL